jgi:hypothetical protein
MEWDGKGEVRYDGSFDAGAGEAMATSSRSNLTSQDVTFCPGLLRNIFC